MVGGAVMRWIDLAGFARGAKVIHLDLDASEIGKNVPTAVGLVGDAKALLQDLIERTPVRDCEAWRSEIAGLVRPRVESFRGGLSPAAICSRSRPLVTLAGRSTITSGSLSVRACSSRSLIKSHWFGS